MDKSFWLDKWEKQEIGFHLAQVHPLLKKYYQTVFSQADGVFVPLCGKTTDLTFLLNQGKYVLGCELSEKAVAAYFQEHRLEIKKQQLGEFVEYQNDHLSLLVGDFFKLSAAQLVGCQAIYDRAALIALPESMRKQYVAHLTNLMPHASLLLVTLEYPQPQMAGPPFSVEKKEIDSLFAFAEVNSVYTNNIIEKEPKFAARGLSYLNECAYIIRW
ncbi:thiopurine S-methyltransferase [Aliikangiella marina]|uniref:Thiopurine S-methyltransferase n=1 Tax=Aliikangiella marina TaxID=1712262 RepID=A0A545TEE3_9GAMM|nr:thiopurine S-methyltransferase [Aliikangiella marina]TQV75589.1 thiopurine S-methyltransferase [Aliikangiella marina]